ncbi:hypothetical protein tb265_16990 [Gemmatimonadetes bacterium T265]|nr:hypothetical protein tb265_16990 [Gemmatimonadetes bacterium T265]
MFHTTEMVDALNDAARGTGVRYETVYGELLVTMPPRLWHQIIVDRLVFALRLYALTEPTAGYVSGLESKFTFQRRDTYTMPDVWAASMGEMRELDWFKLTVPLLCAEVLSKSSRRGDRFTKRALYQSRGVPLYWVIDGDRRHAEVWRPHDETPHVETEALVWEPAGAAVPFRYALAELFAPL